MITPQGKGPTDSLGQEGNDPLGNTPEQFIRLIIDLPTEQQIDMAMFYCQASPHWREFINNPVSGAWIQNNADALNRRARRSINGIITPQGKE
jgi:hypothetical protein